MTLQQESGQHGTLGDLPYQQPIINELMCPPLRCNLPPHENHEASAAPVPAHRSGIVATAVAMEAAVSTLTSPKGWRAPTPAELSTESLRKNSPTKYVEARADFDG